MFFVASWLLSRTAPDPEYHVEFESNLEKLSSYILRTVPASNLFDFDDYHFAQHGRVYLKLFQIVRCMQWQSESAMIDKDQRRYLNSQIESLQAVMKNYRFLPPSQIAHVCHEVSKVKPCFENA